MAANAEGYARLGLPRDTRGTVALDPASPALHQIKAIAAEIAPGDALGVRLSPPIGDGDVPLSCDAYRLHEAPELLVIAVNDDQGGLAPTRLADPHQVPDDKAPSALANSFGRSQAALPRRQRDDAATLAEMGLRIREGLAELRSRRGTTGLDAAEKRNGGTASARTNPASRPNEQARLAHELRTPLSAIMAAAEIMRDERFGPLGDARYRSYAADIHESARHALGVIEAMLGMREEPSPRSAEASDAQLQLQLQFAEIDVEAITESALSSMQPLAEEAGLSLAFERSVRCPRIIADAVSVRQIVLNLLTNALKFTAPGGSVKVATQYRPDGPLVIEVSDSGRGMDIEELARARGEASATADSARQARAAGSLGIGLELVRALAKANGATVAIDSARARGTTVRIAFGRDRVVPV